ncbi:MAG TPA: ATP-binding cassette domain-containing protein [Candidatus Binataceae bacterium]|nr:ATP-binding cassette domain-containing protein [Candidatus Binataceae bacterium]
MIRAVGIRKRFGRTLALDGVDFIAHGGEIHALIGENGAGKSTLVNILAGRLDADGGAIELDGVALRERTPAAMLRAGVAAVFQSPMLFEGMSWEENLAFGGASRSGLRLDLIDVAAGASRIARELGFGLPAAGALIAELSIAARIRLEIVRALNFRPRVLILDEPTSVLAPAELVAFLAMLRRLRTDRRAVIIVTHKLGEALAVSDRFTVLRAGVKVAERTPTETSATELARLMVGELTTPSLIAPVRSEAHTVVLALENIVCQRDGRRVLDALSLSLAAGEIVGIAGVDGNGQDDLTELLAGVIAPSAGKLRQAGEGAVAVIPRNRDIDGLILEMPLWENLLLARVLRRRFTLAMGLLRRRAAIRFCAALLERFAIRAPSPAAPAATLSGGNRQRLMVARALACASQVIVAHDISRGLDLRATAEVHRRLREYAAAGGAVLLLSSDLDELLALCGRLWVISRGRLVEVGASDRNPEQLGLLMSGAAA